MMKRFLIGVIIAALAGSVVAAPPKAKAAEPQPKAKVAQQAKAKGAKAGACKGCASMKGDKKAAKAACCGGDPFIQEANRMMAASEGKKSTGCACKDMAAKNKKKPQAAKAAKA